MNKTLGQRFLHLVEKQKKLNPSNSATNLPSISLNQLQKEVNVIKKRKYLKQISHQQTISNNKELNVTSPFYDRMKTHKQNCKCPYHRKRRLQLLPSRHTVKTGLSMKRSMDKLKQSNSQMRLERFSNNQRRHQNKFKLFNRSSDLADERDSNSSRSQNFGLKSKIQTKNQAYEVFLKECEFHLLRRKGFSAGKPQHVVRKGLKQIFQFINNNLDYTVEKMTEWINGIQKDRDYGEFYIERFREMKKNYEINLMKKKGKKLSEEQSGDISKLFSKTSNYMGDFKSKFAGFNQGHGKRYNSMSHGLFGFEGKNSLQNNLKNGHIYQDEQNQDDDSQNQREKQSQKYLNRIFGDLKDQNTVSEEVFGDILNLELKSFQKVFSTLQNNVINDKYNDQLLAKLQSGVMSQLIKRTSYLFFQNGQNPKFGESFKNFKELINIKDLKNSKNVTDFTGFKDISDLQQKLQIILKTQEIIKNQRSRKGSNLNDALSKSSLSGNNQLKKSHEQNKDIADASNLQNKKKSSEINEKKSGNKKALQKGQKNKLDEQSTPNSINPKSKKFGLLKQQLDSDDQTESDRKRLKNHGKFSPHARRSRLMKDGDLFRSLKQSLTDETFENLQFRKQSIELHRGNLTKAEKYLFQINMGKTIIKNDDCIFTAKRKMRVIKQLLNETPHAPEADTLRNYVKQIEQKILFKTQKDKKLKDSLTTIQNEEIKEQQIWRSISLDNLGFELIFYNISSSFKIEDHDDLCILLNEWKLHDMRSMDNHLSFKVNLVTDEDQVRKSKKKGRFDDTLIQDGMRNMEFQPKLQPSDRVQNDLYQSKLTKKTSGKKNVLDESHFGKQSKMNHFHDANNSFNKTFTEDDFEGVDEQQLRQYNKKVKEMFKYARVNLPQTFEKYVKNTSNGQSVHFSFDESSINIGNIKL